MKIKALTSHHSENLTLVYDREAKASLARMAEAARYAVHPDYLASVAPEMEEDFAQALATGADVLQRIGAVSKGRLKITKSEMIGALMAAGFTCTFFAAKLSPVPPLSSAMILLAQVTSVPFIGRLCLPPIQELFQPDEISQESWKLYERIRCWDRPEDLEFFVLAGDRLMGALEDLPEPLPEIELLIETLMSVIGCYACARISLEVERPVEWTGGQ
jgi:hypothetical protein